MDKETRALRSEIVDTREELGEAVQQLSERLAPRQQAERIVTARREAAVERLRNLSSEDLGALASRVRDSVQAHPRPAAAIGAVALLLIRRRQRQR